MLYMEKQTAPLPVQSLRIAGKPLADLAKREVPSPG